MCPSLASFDGSVMLAVAVDSRTQPSYILVWHKRSKNDPFGQGVTLYVRRSHKKLCAVSAVLAYLAIHSPAPGSFIEDGGVLLGSSWSPSSQLHCRKLGLTPHHTRVRVSVLEQLLRRA